MGCDIHVYIESKPYPDGRWWGFGGRLNPGRDYHVFGALAGVRCRDIEHIPPRGLPDDCAHQTWDDNHLRIAKREHDDELVAEPDRAAEWVAQGASVEVQHYGCKYVTHPDWHSHTWLTLEEWRAALARAPDHDLEYDAVTAVLETLSRHRRPVRVVFWFDN